MIRLETFTNKNERLLEFNFNNPKISYQSTGWINIFATKQKITISGNSFIAYDTEIGKVNANTEDFLLAKDWIQSYYKENEKILLISSCADEPLFIFHGTTISISNIKNNYAEFSINNKKIFINNLHWLILTHNTSI